MISIKDKKDCTGCYSCSNICPHNYITMEIDTEGFWYPRVDNTKCTKCGLCLKVCPIKNKITIRNIPIAYACINKNEAVRLESSSGGIFTLIAEQVIDNGGIVFGAGFNIDNGVEHNYVETKGELYRFRGSKYVQSKTGDTYKQIKDHIKQGKEVLFSGTPCQVAGLKLYIGQPYSKLFCIDIVCHGVPSPKVWEHYISYREKCAGAQVTPSVSMVVIDLRKKYSRLTVLRGG